MELSLSTISIFGILYIILLIIGYVISTWTYIDIRNNPGPQGLEGVKGPVAK